MEFSELMQTDGPGLSQDNLAAGAFASLSMASGADSSSSVGQAILPPGVSAEFLKPNFDLMMNPRALHLPDESTQQGTSLAQMMRSSAQAAQKPPSSPSAPTSSMAEFPAIAGASSTLAQIALTGDFSGKSLMGGVNALAALAGPSGKEVAAILSRAQQIGEALGVETKDIVNLFSGEAGALGDMLKGDFSSVSGPLDAVLKGDFSGVSGKLGDIAGGLEGFAMGQLSPQAQAAISVAKQALQAMGLPSDLKSLFAPAQKSASPAPPGIYVEGHTIATLVLSGTVHGVPLQPGPGALTVLANKQPVWRTVTDKHACPLLPPHGIGAVAVGATKTYAEKFLIARHDDMVIEPGSGEVKIVPMKIAAAIAEARKKAAAEKAKQEQVAKDKAVAETAKQGRVDKEKAANDKAAAQEPALDAKPEIEKSGEPTEAGTDKEAVKGRRDGLFGEKFNNPNENIDGGIYLIDRDGQIHKGDAYIGDYLDPNLPPGDQALVQVNGMNYYSPKDALNEGGILAIKRGVPVVLVFNQAQSGDADVLQHQAIVDGFKNVGWLPEDISGADAQNVARNFVGAQIGSLYTEPAQYNLERIITATNGHVSIVPHSEGNLITSRALYDTQSQADISQTNVTGFGAPPSNYPDGPRIILNEDPQDSVTIGNRSGPHTHIVNDDPSSTASSRDQHQAGNYFNSPDARWADKPTDLTDDEEFQKNHPRPTPVPGPTPSVGNTSSVEHEKQEPPVRPPLSSSPPRPKQK